MKYLFFIILLVAVIITAGCVGGNQNSAVAPTPQIVYVTVLVTSIPTPVATQIPLSTNTQAIDPNGPNIVVKSSYKASAQELLMSPTPMSVHIEAVNIGKSAGINVQTELNFLYNNQVVKKQTIYFGTINAGSTIAKDELVMVTFPVDPGNVNPKLIILKFPKITLDGKEAILYTPS